MVIVGPAATADLMPPARTARTAAATTTRSAVVRFAFIFLTLLCSEMDAGCRAWQDAAVVLRPTPSPRSESERRSLKRVQPACNRRAGKYALWIGMSSVCLARGKETCYTPREHVVPSRSCQSCGGERCHRVEGREWRLRCPA